MIMHFLFLIHTYKLRATFTIQKDDSESILKKFLAMPLTSVLLSISSNTGMHCPLTAPERVCAAQLPHTALEIQKKLHISGDLTHTPCPVGFLVASFSSSFSFLIARAECLSYRKYTNHVFLYLLSLHPSNSCFPHSVCSELPSLLFSLLQFSEHHFAHCPFWIWSGSSFYNSFYKRRYLLFNHSPFSSVL